MTDRIIIDESHLWRKSDLFAPPVVGGPALHPWSSPGRTSFAKWTVSPTDVRTWVAAAYIAANPGKRLGRITLNGEPWRYLIQTETGLRTLSGSPLDSY